MEDGAPRNAVYSSIDMNAYKHTQLGKLVIVVMSAASLIALIFSVTVSKSLFGFIPLLALVGWLFHALTIEIAGGELRWRFGPGFIRKCVPLAQIASAEAVRTSWLEGWGIHFSRFGWLYNVSGFDAVAITLQNGKRFALGTDEPQKLTAILQQALKK